ncbi:MAG: type II toxin-antitoxin system HicB family antitoxin [Proteobacteria bacterium]|nr:type II toxin-antitoxin system HicB family antitoxin [Pseudomonadota bacterium]
MAYKVDAKNSIIVQFNIHLPAVVAKKEKWFTASCPILDVVTQGETVEKARANLAEALSLFLISCHERGMLDAVLKNCGFRPAYNSIPVKVPRPDSDYINVPLPFIIDMGDPQRCHA